jgi:hypothetical protein
MRIIELVQIMDRNHHSRVRIAFATCALAASFFQVTGISWLSAADKDKAPKIVIRPANFDPADELAYTRQRGELAAGSSASGKIWNRPQEDSRAAVSGEEPAPADAKGLKPPVSAASGASVPLMTYNEAYAQIPFSRSEYEANPNYRHDAAMELMFGTMRPMMISRMNMPYFSRYPDLFRYRFPVFPYPDSGYGDMTNTNMYWNTSLIAY